MTFKRYIKINGRRYGPYAYKSYRDSDGRVKNEYFGKNSNQQITLSEHPKIKSSSFRSLILPLAALIFIVAIIGLLGPSLTGYAVKGSTYTDNINLQISSSQESQWAPENPGAITSLKVSGKIIGAGDARIYIKSGEKSYLVYDSAKGKSSASAFTGFAIASTEGGQSTSDSQASADQTPAQDVQPSDNQANIEPEHAEPVPSEQSGQQVPSEQSPDQTPSDTNQPVQEQPPEQAPAENPPAEIINSSENTSLQAPAENPPAEIINSSENITSAQNITEKSFDAACDKTCILGGLNQSNYTLVFEVDAETELDLENIIYTLKKGAIAENATNATEALIIPAENITAENATNITEVNYDTIQEDPQIQAVIDSADYDNESGTLTVLFHHESDKSQPIKIISDRSLDYSLSANESAPNENVSLTVNDWNPDEYFEIKIGAHSQVFGIGNIPEYNVDTSVKDAAGNAQNVTVEFEMPVSKEIRKEIKGKSEKDKVQKGKYNIKIAPESGDIKEITINDVNVNDSISNLISIDTNVSVSGFMRSYAIDPTAMPEFTSANVTAVAQGTELYKCKNWNFTEQNCSDGNWTKIIDIIPGENYTFTLTPEDPGYAELDAQACKAEDSATKSSFASACTGTYPAACGSLTSNDRLSCDDGYYESHTFNNGVYGGVRVVTYANASVTDCSNITNVDACYEWWSSGSSYLGNCDVSVNNSASGWQAVTTTCPGVTANPGVTCTNVHAKANWTCANFFGPSGSRAMIKSELDRTSGTTAYTIYYDVLYFRVNYTTGPLVPAVSLVSPEDGYTELNTQNVNFVYNVSSNWDLSECDLYLKDPLGFISVYGNTTAITKNANQTISAYFGYDGDYAWSVMCTDINGNVSKSEDRGITLSVPGIESLTSPAYADYILHNETDSQFTSYKQMKNVSVDVSTVSQSLSLSSRNTVFCWPVSWLANNFSTLTLVNGTWRFSIYTNCSTAYTNTQYNLLAKIIKVNSTGEYNFANTSLTGFACATGAPSVKTFSYSLAYSANANLSVGDRIGTQICSSRSSFTSGTTWLFWETTYASKVNFPASYYISPPVTNLISPADANVTASNSVNFTCNATTTWQLSNITLYWNYSGAFIANQTISVSGTSNRTSFSMTNLNNSAIRWNCLACDNVSQCSFASANRTVTVNYTATNNFPTWSSNQTSIQPTYSPSAFSLFNITWSDDYGVSLVRFESNYSGNSVNYTMNMISGSAASGVYNFSAVLPAGTFYWKSYANDTANQWNSTSLWFFTIAKAAPTLNYYLNGANANLTVPYSQQVNASGNVNVGTLVIYLDGNQITNGANYTLGVGYHRFDYNVTGNANYTDLSATLFANITKIAQSITPLLNGNNANLAMNYPQQINASYSGTNQTAVSIKINGTYVNIGQNYTWAVGVWDVNYSMPANQNYSEFETHLNLTISQAAGSGTLLLNGTAGNINLTYPGQVNASFTNSTGAGTLLRDGADITGSNNVYQNLAGGYYNFTLNVAANQNYSAYTISRFANITKAASSLNLTLNGTQNNISISAGSSINLNCSLINPSSGVLQLYKNGDLINSGNSPIGNLTAFSVSGSYNITCVYNSNQNYTSFSQSYYVAASDSTPPASVTGLNNISNNFSQILWNWTNPADADFNYTIIYLNGIWQENISAPDHNYSATWLASGTNYNLTIQTVDNSGNLNYTNVTNTAKTLDGIPALRPAIGGTYAYSGTYPPNNYSRGDYALTGLKDCSDGFCNSSKAWEIGYWNDSSQANVSWSAVFEFNLSNLNITAGNLLDNITIQWSGCWQGGTGACDGLSRPKFLANTNGTFSMLIYNGSDYLPLGCINTVGSECGANNSISLGNYNTDPIWGSAANYNSFTFRQTGNFTNSYLDAAKKLKIMFLTSGKNQFNGNKIFQEIDFADLSVGYHVDNMPPAISISYPQNTTYSINISTLNFTASDANLQACWYSLNGGANISASCTANITGLSSAEGPNTWIVYANDSAGNVNSSSVTFIKDTTPPSFNASNTQPQPNSIFNQTNIIPISINPSENLSSAVANISWDSTSKLINLTFNGTQWFYNAAFANTTLIGVYTITITANDTSGNSNTTTTNFTIKDITAPSITNIQPAAGSNYNQSQSVNITVNVTDYYYDYVQSVICQITYPNGTKVNYTLTEVDNTQIFDSLLFSDTSLAGRYNITITANDTSGNVNISSGYFIINDVTAPALSNITTSPALPLYNKGSSQNISVNFSLSEYPVNVTFSLYNSTGSVVNNITIFVSNASQLPAVYTLPSLTVNGNYTLNMSAADSSGNTNTTKLGTIVIDTVIPNISIDYPKNITYNANVSSLNYTVSDINLQTCWYSLNGGTNITIPGCGNLTGLNSIEGNNTWTVYANDSAGNVNSKSVTFLIDTIAPFISIDYPKNITYTANVSSLNYTVSGAVNCWFSDEKINKTIACGLNLTNLVSHEGNNTWTVYANDSAGNENFSSVTFFKDTIAPVFSIYSPLNKTYANNSILINFTATDNNAVSSKWFFNGTANVTYSDAQAILLSDGIYSFIFYANDSAGNLNQTTVVFSVDTTAPFVQVVYPANANYNTNVSDLNYTVSGAVNCWFSDEKINKTIACGANFTGLTSTEGWNTWTVYANDSVNNVNSSSVTFFKDTIAPTISFVSPKMKAYSTNSVLVDISASDSNGISKIWWNNETDNLTYLGAGYFNFSNGFHTIYAYANDSLGNFNSTSVNFLVDTNLPVVDIISPSEIAYPSRTILLNISSSGIFTWYSWNGTNITYSSPIYVTFSEGSNFLQAWANNTAGLTGYDEANFFTDDIPPYWTNNKTNVNNSIKYDDEIYFNITLDDNYAGGNYIYSYDTGAGIFINSSEQPWASGQEISAIENRNVIATRGQTIRWYWIFTDSLGNSNQTEIWSATVANTPPDADNVHITPSNPIVTSDLFCNYAYSDDDNDNESGTTFAWFKNDVKQPGLNSQLVTSGNLSEVILSDKDVWKCQVTPKDGFDFGIPENSTPVVINGSNPTIVTYSANSTSTNPKNVGENITFTVNWSDPDQLSPSGENASIFVCNTSAITYAGCAAGAKTFCNTSKAATDPASCNYLAQQADNTTVTYYVIVCDDTSLCSPSVEQGTFSVNHAPNAAVNIAPASITVADNLTCTYTFNDIDLNAENLTATSFKWFKNDIIQPALTSQKVLAGNLTKNDVWICQVTVVDEFNLAGAPANSSGLTVGSSAPAIVSFTDNSNPTSPTNVGSNVTFTLNWSDPDQPNENVSLYVCNSNATGSSGCADRTFCSVKNSSKDPIDCNYTALQTDNTTETYWAIACDISGLCSGIYSGTFDVNHAPVMSAISLIPSVAYRNDTLTCLGNYSDQDSDSATLGYVWFNNSAVVIGQNSNSFDCKSLGCIKHDNITCQITPTDEHGLIGLPISATRAISNSLPYLVSNIPNQNWQQNSENNNAFNLSSYFHDLDNDTLIFSVNGNTNINVSINPATGSVNFSQPAGWIGTEYIIFSANDSESIIYSNNITLTVTSPPSGGGGAKAGGGGGGAAACTSNWQCSDWSSCANENQTRSCLDLNNCGTVSGKPAESQFCAVTPVISTPIPAPPTQAPGITPEGFVSVNGEGIEAEMPKMLAVPILTDVQTSITIKNTLNRPLSNVEIAIDAPKPDVSPQPIHPYPTVGWSPAIATLIGGIGIRGTADYESLTGWRINPIYYDSIEAGQTVNIPLNIVAPAFKEKTETVKIDIMENGKVIMSYDVPVNLTYEKFFTFVDTKQDPKIKDVFIGFDNTGEAKKEQVTIEMSINNGDSTLIEDYLGPYNIEANSQFLIGQEYETSEKIASQKGLRLRLSIFEKGKLIKETETAF